MPEEIVNKYVSLSTMINAEIDNIYLFSNSQVYVHTSMIQWNLLNWYALKEKYSVKINMVLDYTVQKEIDKWSNGNEWYNELITQVSDFTVILVNIQRETLQNNVFIT